MEVLARNFALRTKVFDRKKNFRQFSDSPKFRGCSCPLPLPDAWL